MQSYIRQHFWQLLKLQDSTLLHTVASLSDMELTAYSERLAGCIELTPANWRYDFRLQRDHPFNLDAQHVLARDFLQKLHEGCYRNPNPVPLEFWDEGFIFRTFHDQLRHIHQTYREQIDSTGGKMATRQRRNARNQRKLHVGFLCPL